MIAIDWGTSSLRAYRLAADGTVLAQRHAALGLLACRGRFAEVLAQQLDGWDEPLVLMAGMIGSRNGWQEVAYAACPAGVADIAAGLHELPPDALPGRRLLIVPGLSHRAAGEAPEVMRGEETQIVGLMDTLAGAATGADAVHRLCLPGTHSKWVQVANGRITAFRTAMTGELYALMRQHSLLAALMPPQAEDRDDAEAFERGVVDSARAGGLSHHLFGVRTLGLFGALQPAAAASYLSGLLIGHELRAMWPSVAAGRAAGPVHLIGASGLVDRYARALGRLGASSLAHGEALAARGLHALARARGLVP